MTCYRFQDYFYIFHRIETRHLGTPRLLYGVYIACYDINQVLVTSVWFKSYIYID